MQESGLERKKGMFIVENILSNPGKLFAIKGSQFFLTYIAANTNKNLAETLRHRQRATHDVEFDYEEIGDSYHTILCLERNIETSQAWTIAWSGYKIIDSEKRAILCGDGLPIYTNLSPNLFYLRGAERGPSRLLLPSQVMINTANTFLTDPDVSLIVHPGERRRGLGTLLVQFVANSAKRLGCLTLHAETMGITGKFSLNNNSLYDHALGLNKSYVNNDGWGYELTQELKMNSIVDMLG